jgi:hypothetical protein
MQLLPTVRGGRLSSSHTGSPEGHLFQQNARRGRRWLRTHPFRLQLWKMITANPVPSDPMHKGYATVKSWEAGPDTPSLIRFSTAGRRDQPSLGSVYDENLSAVC